MDRSRPVAPFRVAGGERRGRWYSAQAEGRFAQRRTAQPGTRNSLLTQAGYLTRTLDGLLRKVVYFGPREEKPPCEIVRARL